MNPLGVPRRGLSVRQVYRERFRQWVRKRMPGYGPPPERWKHMEELYHGEEIVVLDCETSQFDKKKGELLSVAAVVVSAQSIELSNALDLTVQTDVETHPDAVRVHHLRREDRIQGVTTAEAVERLLDFIGNRPICGFYIEFDRAVLNRYTRELHGFELPNRFIEVSELYARNKRRHIPELSLDLTFEGLANDLDVPIIGRHTALGDVISTALMLIKLTKFDH